MIDKRRPKKQLRAAAHRPAALTLTRTNYLLLIGAALLLIVGYLLMSIGPADSFWSLTLSPIVLVIAYCIVFPLAILWKPKSKA